MIVVYTDGLCEPINPKGVATFGFTIDIDPETRWRESGYIGEGDGMTNQVAEYMAVIKALLMLKRLNLIHEEIAVYTDSMLVVGQMSGRWGAHRGEYLAYHLEAKKLVETFKNVKFEWVPREQNKEADRLSQIAYETHMKAQGKTPKYHKRR